jgi:hypothetical protein
MAKGHELYSRRKTKKKKKNVPKREEGGDRAAALSLFNPRGVSSLSRRCTNMRPILLKGHER